MAKKRIILTVLLVLGRVLYSNEYNAEIDINLYQSIIFTIINNLSSIMENNQASEIVYNTYRIAVNAIRNNRVSIMIDPDSDKVLSGMYVNLYDSDEISLIFGLKFLDTYNPNNGIHYAILIHEYRHIHDLFTNNEAFANAKRNNDEKEVYWYELDALRIEAEFIKYYLNGNLSLSRFESYVLNSFETDYLDSASMILLRESMNYFFYFDRMERNYRSGETSKDEIILWLEQNGRALINNFNSAQEDFLSYFHYTEINTFRKYLIRILSIIVENPLMTWGEVFEQYPNIENIYNEMGTIINNHSDRQSLYRTSIIEHWEDDILVRAASTPAP